MWVRRLFSRSMRPKRLPHQNVTLKASMERLSRSGSLQRWVGTRAAAPFPTPLSPLAALLLRCAPDMFLLTKPNTSCTIEVPASLRSDGVRDHPGFSVRLRRNPHQWRGDFQRRGVLPRPQPLQLFIDPYALYGFFVRGFGNRGLIRSLLLNTVQHLRSISVRFGRLDDLRRGDRDLYLMLR
jgi:hypothetical protein